MIQLNVIISNKNVMQDFGTMTWTEELTSDLMQKRLDAVELNNDVLSTVESVSIDINSIF
jgi:hypothetical protein